MYMPQVPLEFARRVAIFVMLIAALLASGLSAAAAPATPTAEPAGEVALVGLLDNPATLTLDDLATYEAETVDVTYRAGDGEQSHSFTGTRLWGVLDDHGIQVSDERSGPLRLVVLVTARDGYVVALSLGEIAPRFGNAPILLAWEQNGETLAAPRLVVPGDVYGGRYVSDIASIEVLGLPDA